MKKIILMITMLVTTNLLAENFSFRGITGTWKISSPNEYKSVTFAKDNNSKRGSKFTLEFNREGKVRVNESGNIYVYRIKNGRLEIAKNQRQFNLKRTRNLDIIKIIGRLDNNCKHVKVVQKGMGGYNSRDGYKMCKIENIPNPTYTREPYKF